MGREHSGLIWDKATVIAAQINDYYYHGRSNSVFKKNTNSCFCLLFNNILHASCLTVNIIAGLQYAPGLLANIVN